MAAMSGQKTVEFVANKQIKTLLAFSCGKDAIAAWLAIRDHFDEVIPYYLYLVPDLEFVNEQIAHYEKFFGVKITQFDVWNATHLRTQLQGYGLDVEPFPQTYQRYSPVAKSAEVLINRQMIEHNGDPILSWALSNVVMESDANANIKPNKKKSANKIDPAIAFLMALGTYQLEYGDLAFEMSAEQQKALAEFNGLEL